MIKSENLTKNVQKGDHEKAKGCILHYFHDHASISF